MTIMGLGRRNAIEKVSGDARWSSSSGVYRLPGSAFHRSFSAHRSAGGSVEGAGGAQGTAFSPGDNESERMREVTLASNANCGNDSVSASLWLRPSCGCDYAPLDPSACSDQEEDVVECQEQTDCNDGVGVGQRAEEISPRLDEGLPYGES